MHAHITTCICVYDNMHINALVSEKQNESNEKVRIWEFFMHTKPSAHQSEVAAHTSKEHTLIAHTLIGNGRYSSSLNCFRPNT